MKEILQKLDNKVTYMTVTIAALGLSALVLVLILMSGGATAATAGNGDPQPVVVTPPAVMSQFVPDAPAATAEKLPLTIEVSDATASGLLRAALAERIDTEALSVVFSTPDTMKISAVFTKEALGEFLEGEEVPLVGVLMLVAPDTIQLDLQLAVSVSGEGRLDVQVREVATNGFQLTAHLPEGIADMANAALQSALPDSTSLGGAVIEDGRVVFTLMV